MGLTPAQLAAAAAALLGDEVAAASPVAGGNLSPIARIRLTDGRAAIVKGGPAPRSEARMLDAIRAAGAPAPEVIAADESCLIIEELAAGGQLAVAWGSLGSALAKLHATTGEQYGWHDDYAFGAVAIENAFSSNWPAYWAQHRLLPHVAHVDTDLARRIEALAGAIEDFLPATPAPALLHGDLWSGNVLVNDNAVSGLIDPACYYGHCEVDIAMISVFDHPGEEFLAAYGPLAAGHRERIAIYSLWPALVHVRLFGSGYISMTQRLLTSIGH